MVSSIPNRIQVLFDSNPLDIALAISLFEEMLQGCLDEVSQVALLSLLAARDLNPKILATFARIIAAKGVPFPGHLPEGAIDTCGTGGDHSKSFNISSATSLVLASCGAKVIKHGNRSASSLSGSADVFQAIGVKIDCAPQVSARALKDAGICFCFAPQYYPFLRHFADLRKKLGIRTIFNFLGPLVNPGKVPIQLLGVSHPRYMEAFVGAFKELNKEGIILSGENGGDEILLDRTTHFCALNKNGTNFGSWDHRSFGLPCHESRLIQVNGIEESAQFIQNVLKGVPGPALDTVLANAAAGLLACGLASGVLEGVEFAKKAISEGKAWNTFQTLARISQE